MLALNIKLSVSNQIAAMTREILINVWRRVRL